MRFRRKIIAQCFGCQVFFFCFARNYGNAPALFPFSFRYDFRFWRPSSVTVTAVKFRVFLSNKLNNVLLVILFKFTNIILKTKLGRNLPYSIINFFKYECFSWSMLSKVNEFFYSKFTSFFNVTFAFCFTLV